MNDKFVRLLGSLILAAVLFMAVGCGEENGGSNKLSSLQNENRLLKNEMIKKDKQIASLNEQIAKCQEEKKAIQERSTSGIQTMMGTMFQTMGQENQKLKSRVAELEKELASTK